MARPVLLAAALAALSTPAAALSNAANYLITQEVEAACEGGQGQIEPGAAIERDLTGAGRADLIISHEGIGCTGAASSRSSFCDAQLCSVRIYIRRMGGDAGRTAPARCTGSAVERDSPGTGGGRPKTREELARASFDIIALKKRWMPRRRTGSGDKDMRR